MKAVIISISLLFVLCISINAQRTSINPLTALRAPASADQLMVSNGTGKWAYQGINYVDKQTLSISGSTVSISNGNSIDISAINTDNQTLSLSSNNLSISSGNTVDLSSFLDNTDAQTLLLSGNNLSITGGNTVDLSSISSGTDYYEVFDNITASSVTVTVNGGTLPADITKIIIDRPGIRCAPTLGGTTRDFTVSGSTITFTEPLQAERVQIRFSL